VARPPARRARGMLESLGVMLLLLTLGKRPKHLDRNNKTLLPRAYSEIPPTGGKSSKAWKPNWKLTQQGQPRHLEYEELLIPIECQITLVWRPCDRTSASAKLHLVLRNNAFVDDVIDVERGGRRAVDYRKKTARGTDLESTDEGP